MAGPVPAIPMLTSTALQAIEITGTRPVMTGAGLPVLDEPASEEQRSCVSKDEGASSALWNLLRDAAARLLRMRLERPKGTNVDPRNKSGDDEVRSVRSLRPVFLWWLRRTLTAKGRALTRSLDIQ
jgi:hypothetical protein